nr:hypothetical protein [Flavobacterium piscinae]
MKTTPFTSWYLFSTTLDSTFGDGVSGTSGISALVFSGFSSITCSVLP